MKINLLAMVLVTAVSCAAMSSSGHDRSDLGQGAGDGARNHPPGRAADLAKCCTPGDEDFPKVGGNLGNQNFSNLAQINKSRVRQLGAVWLNHIEGGLTTGTNQGSPVVVDGVIYIESALGNVIAVDGKTGVTKWKYTQTRGTLTRRGVAVGQELVYTLANGNYIIALDKNTGQVVWERQAVIFASTSRDTLFAHGRAVDPALAVNTTTTAHLDAAKTALRQYIRAGGGFVAIHNAFGTEYNWPWYEGLLADPLTAALRNRSSDHPGSAIAQRAG